MNENELKKILDFYKEKLSSMGFKAAEAPYDVKHNTARVDVSHCMWMIDNINKFIDDGRLDKAFRWFGFIQGCLWCCGIFSIDEIQSYNKKSIEE